MFGFLAALGPIGAVAAVAGTVGVAVLASGSNSSKRTDEDLVRHDYNESKKDLIQEEIDLYIEKQITRVRKKYEIDISINTTILELSTSSELESRYGLFGNMKSLNLNETPIVEVLSENTTFTTRIKNTKSNINELTSAIKLLKEAKNEFTA